MQGRATFIKSLGKTDETKLRILKLTSVFHQLPLLGPKQLYGLPLAHLGCIHEAGMYFLLPYSRHYNPCIIVKKRFFSTNTTT